MTTWPGTSIPKSASKAFDWRAQSEVSALPGDDEVTPRFVFVTEVSGQKPAGYDHLGHALRTVRHSGDGAP